MVGGDEKRWNIRGCVTHFKALPTDLRVRSSKGNKSNHIYKFVENITTNDNSNNNDDKYND